ncbi:hypothetical protein LIER_32115 [Lithospermum erythrorhizon]|uniref:Uncharacterized protein n=1 Tax=Lithospermum erythrorhizon TaxID=34254 RepID=A0AAV3RWT2_LITER
MGVESEELRSLTNHLVPSLWPGNSKGQPYHSIKENSSHPNPSRPTGPSQFLQGSLNEIRVARLVVEVGGVYSFDDRTHVLLLSSPIVHYSNRRFVIFPQGNINIDDHTSLPTPALESLHRRSTMSQTSDEFVGSLLRDSPEMTVATGIGANSPNVDDSEGPRVTLPEASKGKGSKEPPSLESVKAKTLPGLITKVQLLAIRNHYDFLEVVQTRILDKREDIDTPTTKTEVPKEGQLMPFFLAGTHGVSSGVLGCGGSSQFANVLHHAGLSKGADNFPKFTLRVFTTPKKSKRAPKVPVPEATPSVFETVVENFGPPSHPKGDPITIVMPDRVSPSLGEVPHSSSSSSSVLHPSESASGSNGPLLPTPYTLPSGVTVTEDSVSRHKESTASLMLKNCMLRRDMEGILECSSPDELHYTFSYFQLRATECACCLFLKWKEADESWANLVVEKSSLEEPS